MRISEKLQKYSYFQKLFNKYSDHNKQVIPATSNQVIPATSNQYSNANRLLPSSNSVKILTDDAEPEPITLPNFSFEDYSEAIVSMIKGSDPKFSIGIYGKWGSGKTTLMKLVENKLRGFMFNWNSLSGTDTDKLKKSLKQNFDVSWLRDSSAIQKTDEKTIRIMEGTHSVSIVLNEEKTEASLTIDNIEKYKFLAETPRDKIDIYLKENSVLTVWFNAWRYEREEQFALIALMKTIGYAMGDLPFYREIKPILLRGLGIIGKDILRNLALRYAMTQKGVDEFEKNLLPKMDILSKVDKDTIYFDGVEIIEKEMKKILKNHRIVVFVDDLDRCTPERAREVFESIKVFLDIEGFVFIIGLSPEVIVKLISEQLEKMGVTGEQYLQKIIQTQIQIPEWNDYAIGDLISKFSSKLEGRFSECIVEKENKELIMLVVEQNPRQTKRFINSLVVALCANTSLDPKSFLVTEALNKQWHLFYQDMNSNKEFRELVKKYMQMSTNDRSDDLKVKDQDKEKQPIELKKVIEIGLELWAFLNKYNATLYSVIDYWDTVLGARQSVKEIPITTIIEEVQTDVTLNNELKRYGLNLLPPTYFEDHKSTPKDYENWKKGFNFDLPSIREGKEFRRNEVIDNIKSKLEELHRLVIVGGPATSKTVLLMEIICDYFDKGYKVLFNLGFEELNNGIELLRVIEGLLEKDKKLLIAVDNAHSEKTATIYYIIDMLSNYRLSENVRFILTARLPEYDWFLKDRLNKVQEEAVRNSIRKIAFTSGFRFEVPFFTPNEIKGFIKKYKKMSVEEDKSLDHLSNTIYKDTNGNPIMVKLSALGVGLLPDVQDRISRYFVDPVTKDIDPMKMQTMLVCSLLDIGSLPITNKFLQNIGLLREAYNLEGATLDQPSQGLWKTIHPRWDEEFISFLYNESSESILFKRVEYFRNALESIFNMKDQKITSAIIEVIYDIVAQRFMPISIVESTFQMPDYLAANLQSNLYGSIIAFTYISLERYEDAIHKCDEAIRIYPNFVAPWNNKGYALDNLYRYDDAIKCYDRAIELNPNYADAWNNKGNALNNLYRYDDAIKCYDRAIELNPNYADAWNNKGETLDDLGKYDEAIECYDKALQIDPIYLDVWNNKGAALGGLERYTAAIECYDKALQINPRSVEAWLNKGSALRQLGRYDEAVICYDRVLELNTVYTAAALNDKAWIFANTSRNNEAFPLIEKSLEIDPNNADALDTKGFILSNLAKYSDAMKFFDRALEIDPQNAEALTHKAIAVDKQAHY